MSLKLSHAVGTSAGESNPSPQQQLQNASTALFASLDHFSTFCPEKHVGQGDNFAHLCSDKFTHLVFPSFHSHDK